MNRQLQQPNTEGADLFISYSSRDADRVHRVADLLEEAGIRVWLDRHRIQGGTIYGSEIAHGIKHCRMLALMCSDASLRSRNVKQEILLAWEYEKPYLPLLLAPVSFPEQVEYWLQGWQWIEILDHPPERWLPGVRSALQHAQMISPSPAADLSPSVPPSVARGLGAIPTPRINPVYPAPGLAGLRAMAKFTDRIWPIPAQAAAHANAAPSTFRGLGAPQEHVRHAYRLGSRLSLAIETDRAGYLTLLDEGPERILYCLCPSWFARDTHLQPGRNYLPQSGAAYEAFELSGTPGREELLALITDEPLGFDWLPSHPSVPARVLAQADVDALLHRLRQLEITQWTALSTYFEVIA